MRKNRYTRILALVMTICMVMGMFAGTVSAAETAAVSVTATSAVEVSAGGHYPVEFVLSNPTATDYSVTLSKSAGDAELSYQGTEAANGTITLSAYTEQKVSGYLTFTDSSAQAAANVTVKVLSGTTVLDTATISVNAVETNSGYKAASWNFDDGLQGWTGNAVTTNGDDLYIAINGGSAIADGLATYDKPLALVPGNLYRLSLRAKPGENVWSVAHPGVFVIVTDYNANDEVLGTSLYDLAQLSFDEYKENEFRFVASDDADYAYSKLSLNAYSTNKNFGNCQSPVFIDDVALVDCGVAPTEIEVPNGNFETVDDDAIGGANYMGNGFSSWTTLSMENRGTTTPGHYGNYTLPYEGAEMMHLRPATEPYYNDTSFTVADEVTVMGKINYQQGNEGNPCFDVYVTEYDATGTPINSQIATTYFATLDWMGFQTTFTKSAASAYFKVGVWFHTAWAGAYIDDVRMYKTGAASAVTDADIAAAAPIEGFQTAVPEMSAPAITALVSTQEQLQTAQAQGGSVKLIADVTISGTQDMTGVELNGHKLNLTATASVTGVTKADVVAPKGYELVVTDGVITVKKSEGGSSSGTFTHKGNTLSLDGIVYLNQYTVIDGFGSQEYIEANGGLLIWTTKPAESEATYENAEIVKEGLIYAGTNGYFQRTDGIPAKKFADELYLRAYVQAADGTYHYGELKEYSVQDYLEGRLASSSAKAEMKNLAAAMLHYGAAAQTYFKYNLKDLANAAIAEAWPADTWDGALLDPTVPYDSAPEQTYDVAVYGKTLSLEGTVLINYYFQPAAGETYTVTGGKLQVWDDVTALTGSNISYEVDLQHTLYGTNKISLWAAASEGFAAKEYRKTIYARAVLYDTEGNVHYSEIVTFSPEEYARGRIENSTNASMVELAKHLVMYGSRATQYFGVTEEPVYIPVDPSAGSEYVVQNNQPKAHIMLTEDATDLEKYAAEELQLHAELVTGATLPITELDPAEDAFTAVAEPSVVYADKNGYYPVQFILKNPTATAMALTLRQKADTETEPVLTVRGDRGNDGVVYLDPYSQLAVSGQFKVEDVYAYPHSEVEVEIVQNGSVIETVTIDFAALASAVNGTFEDGKTGWASGSAVTSAAHSGSGSLRIARTAEAKTNPVKLISGHRYYLSFYAKTNASGATVDVKINDYNASGAALRTPMSFSRSGIKLTSGEWTRYECSFIANTSGDESYAYSVLSLMNNATAGTNFDDVQLINLGEMPEEVKANGDFETFDASGKPTNWWMNNHGWRDSKTFYTGSNSAKVIASSSFLGYGGFSCMERGKTYAISFWAKSQTNGSTIQFSMDPWVGYAAAESSKSPVMTMSTEWERYEVVYKAPTVAEGTKYNGTYLSFSCSAQIWMDHFRVHEIDAAVALEAELKNGTSSGGTLPAEPTMAAPVNNDLTIVIATPDSYPELESLFGDDLTWIGDTDGFAIRQLRGTIYIFGTEPRGALNGVYDFIEDNMGVIWMRADDTAYEPMASVKPTVEYREKSPFAIRSFITGGTGRNGEQISDSGTEIMLSRNKLNAKQTASQNGERWDFYRSIGLECHENMHNVGELVTGSPIYDPNEVEYWNTDENGNYITVANGATDPITYNINFYSQKTVDAVYETLISKMKSDPDRKYIGVGMHDTGYMVNKPYSDQAFEYAPGKLIYPSASNYKSTVFFTWLNKIAVRVAEQYPDVTIVTMAYNFNQYVPACDLADNIQILFCPLKENLKEPLDTTDTADANYKIHQDLLGWTQKTTNIVFYNYYGYAYPGAAAAYMRPIGGKIQSDLQYYAEHGYTGTEPEAGVDYNNQAWDMNSLTYWLYQKFTWDPYADIDELTEQFCDTVYGPASQYMQTYYDLLQQAWDSSSVDYNIDFKTKDYINNYIISAGASHAKAMRTALNNAYNAVSADSAYRGRIAYIRDTFDSVVGDYAPWHWFW